MKWDIYDKRREEIEKKKKLIEEGVKQRGAAEFLKAFLLSPPLGGDPIEVKQWVLEWSIAFAEYFEEHPEQWEELKPSSSDPPEIKEKIKNLKEKIKNWADLLLKIPLK